MAQRTPVHTGRGFSLVEVMIVLAIIGILAALAVPSFQAYLARSKRGSAELALDGIRKAQAGYLSEYGNYSSDFSLLALTIDGFKLQGDGSLQGAQYNIVLDNPGGPQTYQATATANVDNDAFLDVLVLNNTSNTWVIVSDDVTNGS